MALVVHGTVNSQIVPLDRKFFRNAQGMQECFVTAVNGERISILFRETQPKGFQVAVEENKEWKPINQANLPEDFQGDLSPALKTLIKICSFTVTKVYGHLTIRIGEARKSEELAIQQLQKRQILQRQIQAIDLNLVNVSMSYSSLKRDDVKWLTDSIGGFGAFSIAVVTPIIIAHALPATIFIPLAIACPLALGGAAVLLLATAGFLLAYYCTLEYFFSKTPNQAKAYETLIAQAKCCFEKVQEASNSLDHNQIIGHVKHFIESLKEQKFVKTFSSLAFEFDETGFNNLRNFYATKDRDKVSEMLRLLILFSLALLPSEARPTDSILKLMQNINATKLPIAIRDYSILARGRLYLDKNNYKSAIADFQSITEESDLHELARTYLNVISNMKPQEALGST
jgi:hypothetical protein